MVVNAGVEIATGVFINPVSPELAAGILKEALAERNQARGQQNQSSMPG